MNIFTFYNRIPLIYRNLGAFVLGCAAGVIIWKTAGLFGKDFLNNSVAVLSPFGSVLVNMLKMIVRVKVDDKNGGFVFKDYPVSELKFKKPMLAKNKPDEDEDEE